MNYRGVSFGNSMGTIFACAMNERPIERFSMNKKLSQSECLAGFRKGTPRWIISLAWLVLCGLSGIRV